MKTTMWNADLGNGMYKNPILYADYSDPDACRAGEDYFMRCQKSAMISQCMDVVYGHQQSVTMTEHFLLVFQCQTKVFT